MTSLPQEGWIKAHEVIREGHSFRECTMSESSLTLAGARTLTSLPPGWLKEVVVNHGRPH